MAAVTIRNLPDETHRALKHRAKLKRTSTEAEIRLILDEAVRPSSRIKIGSELAAFGRKYGPLSYHRDQTPAEPISFE